MMRTLFLAATFAFAFGLLTGCSSSNAPTDNKKTVAPVDSGADKKNTGGKGRFPTPPPK